MFTSFIVALSIACLLTSAFTFRFRMWDRPGVVVSYFATFLILEFVAKQFFLPPGAFNMGLPMIFFPLAAIFVVAIVVARRYEAKLEPEHEEQS